MDRFTNILYVSDPKSRGKSALRRTAALANANQAQLTVADVVERSKSHYDLHGPAKTRELEDMAVKKRGEELEELIAPLKHDGTNVKTSVLLGTPFYELIRLVLREKHDLVIKEARFAAGKSRVPFDPFELHLVRKCPCPVLILKPMRGSRFSRIMAAVDPGPEDPTQGELDKKIIDLATSLARSDNAELNVVHVWDLYGTELLGALLGKGRDYITRLTKDAELAEFGEVENLLSAYKSSGVAMKVHLLKGEPEAQLPKFANKANIDLIVMGTVVRTGIAGIFIGNTAESILNQVDCSYLVLKPDTFVCPISAED